MNLIKGISTTIVITILLLTTTLTTHAGFSNYHNEYLKKGSNLITSANDFLKYTGGIKDDLKHESLKQILASITTLKEGKIGAVVNLFVNNNADWNWVITEGTLPENINGKTELISGIATTTLDYKKLKNATNLSVARTMIHEMVHAYLTLYFRHDGVQASIDHPDILSSWMASKNPDYNEIQHNEIEKTFLADIAESLNEFGQKAGLVNVAESVYTNLAWGGLDFEDNVVLTQKDKERIQYRLIAEQLNRRSGTETPAGIQLSNL